MLQRASGVAAVAAVVSVLAVAAPPPARAEPAPEPKLGIDVGMQLGYGLPFGNVAAGPGLQIDEIVAGVVPVAIDASYRIDDLIAVGLLLQYGVVQFQDTEQACPAGASCGGFLLGTAAQVTLRAPVPWAVVPWLRLGGGYEWLRLSLTGNVGGGATDFSLTLRGVMFGVVQAGADYHLLPALAVGPYVSLSVGRYDFQSTSGTIGGVPPDGGNMMVPDRAAHEWLMFGVRGVVHF